MGTKSIVELREALEKETVLKTLLEVDKNARRWNGGGAPLHRVRAWGALAESGADKIKRGEFPPLLETTTFSEFKKLDKKNYEATINFMYVAFEAGIYTIC